MTLALGFTSNLFFLLLYQSPCFHQFRYFEPAHDEPLIQQLLLPGVLLHEHN